MQAGRLSSISISDDFTLVTLPKTGAVPMFNRSIIGTMDKGLKNKIKKLGSSILSIHNDKIVLES